MSCCRAADADAQTLASTAQPNTQPTSSQSGPLTPAQLAPCAITQQDFETAVKKVQPSVRREGFATTPDVTWSDVGSLAEVNCKETACLLGQCVYPCSECFDLSFDLICAMGGNWDSIDNMLLWVHTLLQQATHTSAMLTLTCWYLHSACDSEHALLRSLLDACADVSVGAGRAIFCHHTAHRSPRAVCSHGLGVCNRGVALRPSRLWKDTCGQSHCERVWSQLHLHQGNTLLCFLCKWHDTLFQPAMHSLAVCTIVAVRLSCQTRSQCLALSTEHVRPACQILQGRFRACLFCTGF